MTVSLIVGIAGARRGIRKTRWRRKYAKQEETHKTFLFIKVVNDVEVASLYDRVKVQ